MDIGQILILDIFLNVCSNTDQRYALDVDEGEPPYRDLPTEEYIRDQLGQEISVGGFFLDSAVKVSEEGGIVIITNASEDRISDIHYITHAVFLSHIRDTAGSSFLESTVRLFTASILTSLPVKRIFTFKFVIPKSNLTRWSVICPTRNEILKILSQEN